MGKEHLRRDPQPTYDTAVGCRLRKRQDVWWYEEPSGLIVVAQGGPVARITWRQIRAALKRKDKKS